MLFLSTYLGGREIRISFGFFSKWQQFCRIGNDVSRCTFSVASGWYVVKFYCAILSFHLRLFYIILKLISIINLGESNFNFRNFLYLSHVQ